MTRVTTHVLDTALGVPAAGVDVVLTGEDGSVATGCTDADGRTALGEVPPGTYRLRFDTGAYLQRTGRSVFFPEAAVAFVAAAGDEHLHVPLLLSPFAWSTYRGS